MWSDEKRQKAAETRKRNAKIRRAQAEANAAAAQVLSEDRRMSPKPNGDSGAEVLRGLVVNHVNELDVVGLALLLHRALELKNGS